MCDKLYRALHEGRLKYADNSAQFSVAATSQLNEIFNGKVAHKTLKIQYHSMNASANYRVLCAVLNFHEVSITTGQYTGEFATELDTARDRRKKNIQLKKTASRQIFLAKKREDLRKNKKSEGCTYERNAE